MIGRREIVFRGVVAAAGTWLASLAEATPLSKFEIVRSDEEWRRVLTREQYAVLRGHETEQPGTSPLDKEHRPGAYLCAGCDLPLFSSNTKFESGTGWPSFWAPIEGAIETSEDRSFFFLVRTEGPLPPLRRSSWACFHRWPKADRPPLLHEWRCA
jgi:peptide-methionine (R)-S-oxide reductase